MPYSTGDTCSMAARGNGHFVKAVFDTPAALADEAAGFLIARGALGCALAKPLRAGAMRSQIVALEAFFDHVTRSDLAGMKRALVSAGMLAGNGGQPLIERIVDPGWSRLWMERFKPLRVGRRWLIVPPWSPVRERGRFTVIVKPAQAFGTGHHASTAGVLRALDQVCAAKHFSNALDVGTGSGILAIAMKLAGVEEVAAIDNDPLALRKARENAALNNLRPPPRFSSIPLARLHRQFDLIVANILSTTLMQMAPDLKRLLKRGGRLILAGILSREARRVLSHYQPAMRREAVTAYRGWATLVLTR